MTPWVVSAIIAGLIVVITVAALWLRRPAPPPPAPSPSPPEDQAERRARQRAVNERGTELLERRVELDARRGALEGDFGLSEALDRLDERRRRGNISEEDYEAEKIRLLGG